MTKAGEIYKCDTCGNVVEVKKAGDGEPVCWGEPMKKQQVKAERPSNATRQQDSADESFCLPSDSAGKGEYHAHR